jgi:hypothetical protein
MGVNNKPIAKPAGKKVGWATPSPVVDLKVVFVVSLL